MGAKNGAQVKAFFLLVLFSFSACTAGVEQKQSRSRPDPEAAEWSIFRGDSNLSGIANGVIPDEPSLLWTFQAGAGIVSTPVMGSGRAFVGATDGKVYALDLANGHGIWEYDTGDDIEASPLLLDGSVYIGSLSGEFFSLDARTGEQLWKFKAGNSIYGSANWVPAPDGAGRAILVGSYDNKMYCLDAATGELRWSYETDNYINGTPATDGTHTVFGGCDENLYVISVEDGTEAGEIWAGSYIAGSAALVDNRAYLGHYGDKLVCIDLGEQKIVWEYADEEHGGAFFSSPAVGEDRVIIGSRDSYVHCVDRETGEKLWAYQTRDEVDSSPVIAGDRVIFGSVDGRVYVVSLESGDEIWSYEIGAEIIGSPAVAGGFVLIGAADGRVYAFG